MAGIEIGLERQQAQHLVDRARDFPDATLAPCPHGRTDVVDRAHAAVVQIAFDAEIEIRRVDAYEDVRAQFQKMRSQSPTQGE